MPDYINNQIKQHLGGPVTGDLLQDILKEIASQVWNEGATLPDIFRQVTGRTSDNKLQAFVDELNCGKIVPDNEEGKMILRDTSATLLTHVFLGYLQSELITT